MVNGFAGIDPLSPRPAADLADLIRWLSTGERADRRLDFTAGTAMPDGRLDLCKQALGPRGAAEVTAALHPGTTPHLLLGTDGLGDAGAVAVAAGASESRVETLYLGCNGITAAGACGIADNLRASPQILAGLWLKRNPLGNAGAIAAAECAAQSPTLRTLDLTQTGIETDAAAPLAAAVITAARHGRGLERLYLGGNPLGPTGADAIALIVGSGAVGELYVSAAQFGDSGAHAIATALEGAPHGRLKRLSVASNGIGPEAIARVTAAAAAAGVEVLDFGRVKAAGVLGAADNRLDAAAADRVGAALASGPHRLTHLVLSDTGLDSRAAHRLLDHAERAAVPTRYLLGKGIATSIRKRLNALSADLPDRPEPAPDVSAIRSVHRTATPRRSAVSNPPE
ncbi:ribonuclease inhibitor [Glycomyces buryatensis]|uniref:Ribonuclease inhibitor n=1 Tax=Glycomyces buryatensis TaxID=2570927 RepID=A0A4S8QCC1_9ACTN|nr:ribonuclease inhibitor [Glycomyces buryatensis]THV42167.1 ribonuclease inhibitor [Glycomyces buryatensis]